MSFISIKKKSLICACLIFCFCFSIANLMSVKAETSGEVPVTYVHDEQGEYSVTVNSKGPGEVRYGTVRIRDGERQFVLLDENIMQLTLKADNDAQIESVHLNGNDVTSEIKSNVITIRGNYVNQNLNVVFNKNIKNDEIPQTGDRTNLVKYVGLLVVASGVFVILYSRKKREEEENNEKQ